jgi:hypothetical protein
MIPVRPGAMGPEQPVQPAAGQPAEKHGDKPAAPKPAEHKSGGD